jgi:hypothetical protein
MDPNQLLASEILSDVSLILDIYGIVKGAGILASKRVQKEGLENKVCVIMSKEKGINRANTECAETTKCSVFYNANHMTIVGGAALSIYDEKLSNLKRRRGLVGLADYMKKKTSDVDINWWPMVKCRDGMIPTSKSKGIVALVEYFIEELQISFNRNTNYLTRKIQPRVNNMRALNTVTTTVRLRRHTWRAGVFNIEVLFLVRDKLLKICDINVHDGGASQMWDSHGNEITEVRPMIEDPVYSDPDKNSGQPLRYLLLGNRMVAVPHIRSLVEQQLFAFDNLLRKGEEVARAKALVHYRRAIFIRNILQSFQLHNPDDRQNYVELLDVFGAHNPEFIEYVIQDMNAQILQSVQKHLHILVPLCSQLPKKSDEAIVELCQLVQELVQSERNKLQVRLEEMSHTINDKIKKATTITFKREYMTFKKRAEHLLQQISQAMDDQEFATYLSTNASSDYMKIEHHIRDIDKRHLERLRQANEKRRLYRESLHNGQ